MNGVRMIGLLLKDLPVQHLRFAQSPGLLVLDRGLEQLPRVCHRERF
jgi:hypothetical protein